MSSRFLESPPNFLFFAGKGGVGKTSMACASAIQLADLGKKVLLVSTDPASNVGQVFGIEIGNVMTEVKSVPNLSALEIDPQAAAQNYRNKIVEPVRGVLPENVVKSIEEQLSGACTTEIAAFDEFTALLTDPELLKKFNHIIFDTAPTGHTIRLLQLPAAWSNFLTEGKGDASCLGPLTGLEKQRATYQAAVSVLADPQSTRLILVARAQASSLREASRTHAELAHIGLKEQYLIINGVLPKTEIAGDTLATAIWTKEQNDLEQMPMALQKMPTDRISLRAFDMIGVSSLRQLLSDEVAEFASSSKIPLPFPVDGLMSLVDGLIGEGHGLIMLMGKGGVGKTTMAAAIAVELAARGFMVHLTTSDPAAHLNHTLVGAMINLSLSRIDPESETENYRRTILANKGKNLDEHGRMLLEEDLRSPCTEEIAVFNAFSRIIQDAEKKFVVMDTAPTGHTLLLLDAAGAYHRDLTRQMGPTGKNFTTPMMQLQDSKQTKVFIVTLAENIPVLEAANLQTELRRAGIEPWGWIINNSLAFAQSSSPLLQQRAKNEQVQLQLVIHKYASRCALVPLVAEIPVGVDALKRLAKCSPAKRINPLTN